MTEIKKLDKKSLIEKRYQEKMYYLTNIIKIVDPIAFNNNDQEDIDYTISTYKCAICRNCVMNFDYEDGVDMYCKKKKRSINVIGIQETLDCRWLNYKYSDLLPYLKNHNISLNAILRNYNN